VSAETRALAESLRARLSVGDDAAALAQGAALELDAVVKSVLARRWW
jgi:hypothetical protein